MATRTKLSRLFAIVVEEASHNAEFAARLEEVLGDTGPTEDARKRGSRAAPRRGGRRAPALVDPVALAHEGERQLRAALDRLELEKLLDVVAEYGMDPGKLVMKWRDRDRVIDRIVEISVARSTKGDAFRLS